MILSLKQLNTVLTPSSDLYQNFMALLEELSRYLDLAEGIKTTARSDNDLARQSFASLPAPRQEAIFQSFIRFYELCLETSQAGESLKDNHSLVLKHLKREGLIPDSEVYDILTKYELVEIHNADFIQTFRTLEFFEYTTHSLEDLFLRPYWELYRRSESVEKQIAQNAARILTGESKGPMYDFIGTTTVREINSRRNILSRLNTIVAAPLYSEKNGQISGIIHVADVLNQKEIKLIRNEPESPELHA